MAMGSIEMLRVLDVGCGCGESTEKLAERQADVTGIDISEPMIAHANRRSEKGERFISSVVTRQPIKTTQVSTESILALAVCFLRTLLLRLRISDIYCAVRVRRI